MALHFSVKSSTWLVFVLSLSGVNLSLSSQSCASSLSPRSQAKLHDDGIRYVISRLSNEQQAQRSAEIPSLVRNYCLRMGKPCLELRAMPARPLNRTALLNAARTSVAFKRDANALLDAVRNAPDVAALEKATSAIDRSASTHLSARESSQLSAAAAIAQSSAKLWAPPDRGGRGGGGLIPPRAGTSRAEIDWNAVSEADSLGCITTVADGCWKNALLTSLAELEYQLGADRDLHP